MIKATLRITDSSAVRVVEYDEATRTLFVTFPTNLRYAYRWVGVDLWDDLYQEFRGGYSVGRFLNEHVLPYQKGTLCPAPAFS